MKNKINFLIICSILSILFLSIYAMASTLNITQTTFIKSITTISTKGYCDMLAKSIVPFKCTKSTPSTIDLTNTKIDVSLINDKTYGNITRVRAK